VLCTLRIINYNVIVRLWKKQPFLKNTSRRRRRRRRRRRCGRRCRKNRHENEMTSGGEIRFRLSNNREFFTVIRIRPVGLVIRFRGNFVHRVVADVRHAYIIPSCVSRKSPPFYFCYNNNRCRRFVLNASGGFVCGSVFFVVRI